MRSPRDNVSMGCAGLVAGTGATVSTGNALPYQVDGRTYFKAATANVAFALKANATIAAVLAASQAMCLFLHLDTAGNLTYSCAQKPDGTVRVVGSATAASYTPGAFEWPQEDKGFACIGAIKITTNASGAFTVGTTALGAANTTATFYNAGDDYGVAIPF